MGWGTFSDSNWLTRKRPKVIDVEGSLTICPKQTPTQFMWGSSGPIALRVDQGFHPHQVQMEKKLLTKESIALKTLFSSLVVL